MTNQSQERARYLSKVTPRTQVSWLNTTRIRNTSNLCSILVLFKLYVFISTDHIICSFLWQNRCYFPIVWPMRTWSSECVSSLSKMNKVALATLHSDWLWQISSAQSVNSLEIALRFPPITSITKLYFLHHLSEKGHQSALKTFQVVLSFHMPLLHSTPKSSDTPRMPRQTWKFLSLGIWVCTYFQAKFICFLIFWTSNV